MDAEALVGRQAGSSTLQRVVGNGTLGVVYLGRQAQTAREVAVKVFLRLASLEPEQQQAFLATFRDEMPRVFALQHPHILPIDDYGDVDGLAYIATPWIMGETLEETLAHEGALPLEVVASCLQQLAGALDYAHEQGMVHRDLKPANIFLTPERNVWVTDFHLTSMLVEGNTAHMRLSRPGLLDYMSPELIVGKQVDKRADLYSLGALVYRMVTGVPPFQGQTLMKVATKHLKMLPPSPRAARPDLPPAVEQVILKSLAKDPAQRFATARDMALLFQHAIYNATASPATLQPVAPMSPVGTRFIASDPIVSESPASGSFMAGNAAPGHHETASTAHVDAEPAYPVSDNNVVSEETGSPLLIPPPFFGPTWRTSSLPAVPTAQSSESGEAFNLSRAGIPVELAGSSGASSPSPASLNPFTIQNGQPPARSVSQGLVWPQRTVQAGPLTPPDQAPAQETLVPGQITWALPEIKQSESGVTGAYKLTGPARIVNIPVAGQPGRYVTGILPVSSQPAAALPTPARHPLLRRWPIYALAALLILGGSLSFVFFHFASSKRPGVSTVTGARTPNFSATASARADANIIVSDPLSHNIRGWPEGTKNLFLYQFKGGAYHITNNDPSRVAIAILPGENLNRPFVYTMTMDEIRGNDASANNESGMILRFNSQIKSGKQIVTFYSFEVVNEQGGQYQFWKYDNSQGSSVNPWKQIASHPFGGEFHQGQGTAHSNTFKILVNGKNFTLIVNGKQAWSVQDSSLTSGQVGMLVNLKGTEVAFSNLLLTWS